MPHTDILTERRSFIGQGGGKTVSCDRDSVSGAVSQRACVYCGARVVLNPITDAYHIIHGPIGCSSYTWDIRGSLSSGEDLYRNSFSTDLSEQDIVFGGAEKLTRAIDEVVAKHHPRLIFVYATCIVGVIGDDVEAVCRLAEQKYQLRCIPVKSPGFSGNKSYGYRMACEALMSLIRPASRQPRRLGVNLLGDFNLAGEIWIIRHYLEAIGIPVIATFTGDADYATLMQAPQATLNLVQCAGSMTYLARQMEDEFGIPYIKVSFFGREDTTASLIRIAQALGDASLIERARSFTQEQEAQLLPFEQAWREGLAHKKAAIYVGGGFKAISLIRQFNAMGMETVIVGTKTGKADDYELISQLVGPNTVILDDANPAELERFLKEKGADLLVGGVKERPLAYKLGLAFCDHNHERRHALAGYEGVRNFTREINLSLNSPVWSYMGGSI
ncbi:MAG: nitrogenase iron-molybdenum cofactor biosynthesis protein NifE [Oscillospiraceae bacterium]|nr:nitrogenase iron-molybdenum cofactor biosynthesis protein NifE [Oscillospiraceae bacterium]